MTEQDDIASSSQGRKGLRLNANIRFFLHPVFLLMYCVIGLASWWISSAVSSNNQSSEIDDKISDVPGKDAIKFAGPYSIETQDENYYYTYNFEAEVLNTHFSGRDTLATVPFSAMPNIDALHVKFCDVATKIEPGLASIAPHNKEAAKQLDYVTSFLTTCKPV